MSITLSDGSITSGGVSISSEIISGSIEFAEGEYLQLSPSSTQFNLVGDFTIEAWVYPTELLSASWGIFDARVNSFSAAPWAFLLQNTSGTYTIMFFDGSYHYGTNTVPLNVWSHVAVVRSGGVLTYYLNGIVDTVFSSYGTGAISPGSTNPAVGIKDQTAGNFGTVGNISNLRIVNGIAVYTAAFTPSSSPLTVVQPQNFNGNPSSFIYSGATVLLLNTTNNDFNFLDISDNHFTLTGPNMPNPSLLSPFFGSLLFNGTSDFLTVPSGVPTTSTTWTIEFWIYTTDNSTQQSFVSTNVPGLNFWKYPGTGQLILDDGAYGQPPIDAYISVNTWTHLAIVRNGDTGATAVYKDGILVGSSVGPYGPLNSTLYIGNYAGSQFYYTGYMSNFRYVSGVAVYTSNFIVPTNQLTSIQGTNVNGVPSAAITGAQTKLLLNTQDTNSTYLADSSSYHYNVVGPNMPLPSAGNPFEPTGSLSFNGSNQYLNVTGPIGPQGTEDYTLEFWTYQPSYGYGNFPRLFQGDYAGFSSNWTGSILQVPFFPSTEMSSYAGQWVHVATTRQGTTAYIFLNGQLIDTNYSATTDFAPGNGNWHIFQPEGGGPAGYLSNFRIVRGIAVYTTDFVPSTIPLTSTQLANVNGSPSAAITGTETSLLLNTINNSEYLLDSSSYQYIVLGTNMPVPDANTPLTGGASSLYNGTNASLLINGSTGDSLDLATGQPDWTIETWFYVNSLAVSTTLFLQGGYVGVTNSSYGVFVYDTGDIYWIVGDGGSSGAFQSAGVVGIETWHHFALVRNGSTLTSYLDGVETATVSMTFNMGYAGTQLTIGSDLGAYGAGGAYFNGYISNFRIVKGIAVYTEEFTPSTNILTATQSADVNGSPSAAITGTETSLLLTTPNNNYNLIDTSSYNWIVSSPGTPSSSIVAPNFLIDGSSSFNGTNNYLTVPAATGTGNPLDLGTGQGDWTVECWFNGNDLSPGGYGKQPLIAYGWIENVTNPSYGIYIYLGQLCFNISDGGGSYAAIGLPIVLSNNVWYHTALVRQGGSAYCFLNGVLAYTLDISSFDQGGYNGFDFAVGTQSPQTPYGFFNGYISNVRVVKGVAVYTSDFIPSTTPLTSIQSANVNGNPSAAITGTETSLLLNTFNSSNNRLDSSSYNFLVTSPNTPVPDDLNPLFISEGSMLFNGTSDYLTVASDPILAFDTGDYTVEFWVYFTVTPAGIECLYTTLTNNFFFQYNPGAGFQTGVGGVAVTCTFPFTVDINTWYHVAVTRSSSTTQCWVNGTQIGTSQTDATSYGETGAQVGSFGGGQLFAGYMSNIRIVKGIAVYTTDFTPPTSNLTAIQVANQNGLPSAAITGTETSLLLNTPNNVLNIIDSSYYKNTITANASPSSSASNPF